MMSDTPEQITIDFEPLGRRARVAPGTSLLTAARQAGVGLNAVCGGGGTCGRCRVRVMEGDVSPPSEAEAKVVVEGLRLACMTRALGDVRIDVPPSSMTAQQRAQVEGHERPVELDPDIAAYSITPEQPSLHDLRDDASRTLDTLETAHGVRPATFDAEALRQLPVIARETDWSYTVIVHDDEASGLAPNGVSPLGLAVDMGTTKLAAYVVDLESGKTVGAAGVMNPQIAYGEDVMARITYAMEGPDHLQELQTVIAGGLSNLAQQICEENDRDASEIIDAVLVGNTCMHHLALGLPVDQMGVAPYLAAVAEPFALKARDMGLRLAKGANVHFLPNIAGFVGADHVSMVLASGIHDTEEITVGLDIGTNTEISLAANGRLLCCSTASGPAFEGAHIHDGMRAAPGAVEWVREIDGVVHYQTIDDAPPVGICGSGILDGVAVLRQIGVLRSNGAMAVDKHPNMRRAEAGLEFVLAAIGERNAPRDIVITRRDVNEIQLAKAAMRTGVRVLADEAGIEEHQIERVVVAGAFGTYLDVASAVAIGMFPDLPLERFDQVGNAAGMGARMALVSRHCRQVAADIARRMEYVELTTHPQFVDLYAESLALP
jgi:uncharacterized 2Fe-2S/4Fe-4S cluster protein (DUF4445 family)